MVGNNKRGKGHIDWELIEKDVLTTPGMTLKDAADKYEVAYRTVTIHGGPIHGNWIALRQRHLKDLSIANEERLIEILAQGRADDVTAIKAIELRLQKVALSVLELLFPPMEAPVEAHLEAKARLRAMSGRELASVATDIARTLTDTGRHRRLLAGKATAIFARAASPDVWIPEDVEQAQEIERRARRAQKALVAAAESSPIDIEGVVIPPDSADSPDPVRVSPVPPAPRKAKDPGGLFGGVAL